MRGSWWPGGSGWTAGQIVFLIVLNLVISFAVPRIAWQAHVGGLVTGSLLTAAYAYAPKQHRATGPGGGPRLIVVAVLARWPWLTRNQPAGRVRSACG